MNGDIRRRMTAMVATIRVRHTTLQIREKYMNIFLLANVRTRNREKSFYIYTKIAVLSICLS